MFLTEPSVFKTVLFIYSKTIKLTSKTISIGKSSKKKKRLPTLCWVLRFLSNSPSGLTRQMSRTGRGCGGNMEGGAREECSVSWEHKQTPCKCPECFKQYSTSLLFPSNAQKEEYYVEHFKTISICPKKTKSGCHWHLESNFSICLLPTGK